jgi:hypothetical protein
VFQGRASEKVLSEFLGLQCNHMYVQPSGFKMCFFNPFALVPRYTSAASGVLEPTCGQCCQMVSFQTKKNNLGKFWRALDWKMLIYFMAIWNILQTFEVFYDPLVHFVFIWHIFSGLGNIYQEKSGNPACE